MQIWRGHGVALSAELRDRRKGKPDRLAFGEVRACKGRAPVGGGWRELGDRTGKVLWI